MNSHIHVFGLCMYAAHAIIIISNTILLLFLHSCTHLIMKNKTDDKQRETFQFGIFKEKRIVFLVKSKYGKTIFTLFDENIYKFNKRNNKRNGRNKKKKISTQNEINKWTDNEMSAVSVIEMVEQRQWRGCEQ